MSRQQRKNQLKALRRKGKGRRQGDEEIDDFDLDECEEEVQVTKKKKKKEKKDEEEEAQEEDDE